MNSTELKEPIVEAFDDDKVEDMLANVINDLKGSIKPGHTNFLRQNHVGLFTKINKAEDLLTVARCNGDMELFEAVLGSYKHYLEQGCRLHSLHLAEIERRV